MSIPQIPQHAHRADSQFVIIGVYMNILEQHAFVGSAQIDAEVEWDREFMKYLCEGL